MDQAEKELRERPYIQELLKRIREEEERKVEERKRINRERREAPPPPYGLSRLKQMKLRPKPGCKPRWTPRPPLPSLRQKSPPRWELARWAHTRGSVCRCCNRWLPDGEIVWRVPWTKEDHPIYFYVCRPCWRGRTQEGNRPDYF